MTEQKIQVSKNGPYHVQGNIQIVRKSQISSEHGEPMTWQKTAELETEEEFWLCRCGGSQNKPFCDGTHKRIGFDGTETAATNSYEERKVVHPGSTDIVIKRDYSVCADSGFCGNRLANIKKLARGTDDSIVRAQVMAMIERCPSGSYSYALSKDGENIEPDLPAQIAVTTEMTSEGPIMGPLWVTGHIPIKRAYGQPLEVRNRMTLCRCGQSKNKPLCDGTHRALLIRE
ncbi:MAG: CDGSH iron-sulfur domain-containing protein [Anaerolineales bacterium]